MTAKQSPRSRASAGAQRSGLERADNHTVAHLARLQPVDRHRILARLDALADLEVMARQPGTLAEAVSDS